MGVCEHEYRCKYDHCLRVLRGRPTLTVIHTKLTEPSAVFAARPPTTACCDVVGAARKDCRVAFSEMASSRMTTRLEDSTNCKMGGRGLWQIPLRQLNKNKMKPLN